MANREGESHHGYHPEKKFVVFWFQESDDRGYYSEGWYWVCVGDLTADGPYHTSKDAYDDAMEHLL